MYGNRVKTDTKVSIKMIRKLEMASFSGRVVTNIKGSFLMI